MEDSPTASQRPLPEIQIRLLAEWVKLADSLGLPRSYAQIYGFIFQSPKPVTAQQCADQLKISRSSAGQGLKVLRDLGAICPHFELGSRAEAFTVEPDLGIMLRAMVESRLLPAFDQFFTAVAHLEQEMGSRKDAYEKTRITKLLRWRDKLNRLRRRFLR